MKNIKLDEFIEFKFLSGINYSQDGKNAAFVVHNADVENNKYLSNIWLYDKGGNHVQLTALDDSSSFIWMEDNEHILFSAMRNEKDKDKRKKGEEFTVYYRININGGEAREAFRIPKSVTGIKELDNDKFLLTVRENLYKKDLEALSEDEKKEELKKREEDKDYEVLDEIPFWSNGGGYTNKIRNRLYLYDLRTKEMKTITDKYSEVGNISLNKDKSKAIFTMNSYKDKMGLKNDIYIYEISTNKLEKVSPYEDYNYGYVNFIEENTIIFTGKDMVSFGLNENPKFYTLDLKNDSAKCITPNFNHSMWNSVGSDVRFGGSQGLAVDNGYLYFITTEGYNSYLNRLDVQGNITKLTSDKGSIDGFDVKGEDILFIGLRDMKIQEIYKLEGSNEKQVTTFNNWLSQEKNVIIPEKITVESEPGVIIDGWVLKPVDFDENKKYPAILDIHGGPKTVYGEVFYHEMQYWANEGYVVFFCNPRGSDGKGNEFADIRGKYGTIDYDDIMKFTDKVLEECSYIDSDKVGVTGGSYGGFMTNWIIGHTDRFKAAASQRSISNWISMFSTTDIGYYFAEDQCDGTPWEGHEKLWEQSPLKYAGRVKTPTLFIHSEEDYRCWVVEGIQMYTALKYHGVESRMTIFKGENHELSRSGKPKHRIRRLEEITNWFDKYLKNK